MVKNFIKILFFGLSTSTQLLVPGQMFPIDFSFSPNTVEDFVDNHIFSHKYKVLKHSFLSKRTAFFVALGGIALPLYFYYETASETPNRSSKKASQATKSEENTVPYYAYLITMLVGAIAGGGVGSFIKYLSLMQEDYEAPRFIRQQIIHHLNPFKFFNLFDLRFYWDEIIGRKVLEMCKKEINTEFLEIKELIKIAQNDLAALDREQNCLLQAAEEKEVHVDTLVERLMNRLERYATRFSQATKKTVRFCERKIFGDKKLEIYSSLGRKLRLFVAERKKKTIEKLSRAAIATAQNS